MIENSNDREDRMVSFNRMSLISTSKEQGCVYVCTVILFLNYYVVMLCYVMDRLNFGLDLWKDRG